MSDALLDPAPVDPAPVDPAPVDPNDVDPSEVQSQVDVVIMAKAFARAKTRLSQLPAALRSDLCAAMLHDTLDAVCCVAASVAVVSDEPRIAGLLAQWGHRDVAIVADPGHGLNAAVGAADRALGAAPYRRPRLAVVADLPCLRPVEFAAIARAVAGLPASFLADADGNGTTMFASVDGPIAPRFGPDSAREHRRANAVPLAGDWPGARRDVDTTADIAMARELGVGAATRRVLDLAEHPTGMENTRGARSLPGPSRCVR